MKILIVSDIHGNYKNMKKVLENNPEFDHFLLLGDILSGPSTDGYDPEKLSSLLNEYKDKIFVVRGNCDHDYDLSMLEFPVDKTYLTFPIGDRLLLMTHGHIYNRYNGPDVSFDVFASGHTHIPVMDKEADKIYLNPGSISLPKGGSRKSYIFYEGNIFYLKDLEKNKVIKQIDML